MGVALQTYLMTGRLSAMFLLASCAELTQVLDAVDIRKPSVSLARVELSSLDFEALGLDLTLTVDNPNPVPVELSGFDYAVFVQDQQLTAGEQHRGLEIPSRGTGSVQVPVQLGFGDLHQLAKGLADAEEFDYRVDATARIAVPVLGELSVPARTSGSLPIPQVPGVAVTDVRVADLGLTGADLVVGLEVTNPNGFSLDVTGLSYGLEVAGASWLSGALPRALKLVAAGVGAVEIPLRVQLLDLGSLVSRALRDGAPLEYRLHGQVEFDTSLPVLRGVSLPFDTRGTAPVLR